MSRCINVFINITTVFMRQLKSPWITHAHKSIVQMLNFYKNDEHNQLETTLYSKPMDTHEYLHTTFGHHAIYKSQYR